MKPFKALSFFALIVTPILVLGYQNCSDLSTVSKNNGMSEFTEFPPAYFGSISDLGYFQGGCAPTEIENVELFNSNNNICIVATNSCELNFLTDHNYTAATPEDCDGAENFNSEGFAESLTTATPKDFGFVADPSMICSLQYQRLLSIKHRKCVDAANGCQIIFLKSSYGFINDHTGICN